MKIFKKMVVFVVIISIVLTMYALVSAVTPPPTPYTEFNATSTAGIVPFYTEKNDSSGLYTGCLYFKPDFGFGSDAAPKTGAYTFIINNSNPLKIQKLIITVAKSSGAHYISKWEAVNISLCYFIVKGGDGFLTYAYNGSRLTDGSLFPPLNNGGNHPTISHISIFYKNTTTESSETTASSSETTASITTASITTASITTTTASSSETTASSSETTASSSETTASITTASETTASSSGTTASSSESSASSSIPSEATVSNATTTLIQLTSESDPLASVTTTTINVTTTGPNTTLTNPNIPLTGENGSANGLLIGLILLALAGALTVVIYRRKSVKA